MRHLPTTPAFAVYGLAAAAALLAGCPVYNANCSYPIADPYNVVIRLDAALPLSLSQIGGQETAFGDAVPDGYANALKGTSGAPPIALEVVSAIHDNGLCPLPDGATSGRTLGAGPVSAETLRDALPDNQPLVTEQIPLRTLFNILEHGVAGPAGMIDVSAANFVEVSGLQYTVDCSQPSEITTTLDGQSVRTVEGQRVVSIRTGALAYARDAAAANTALLTVAMPLSLAQGGSGFFDLRDSYALQGQNAYTTTSDETSEAVNNYLSTLPANADGAVTLKTDGRITLMNCGGQP
jgi:hypothetical protein